MLDEVGDHHDGPDLVLPDHAPERGHGPREGALGGDVRVLPAPTVHEVGVDVVGALHAAVLLQAAGHGGQ